MKQIIKSSPPFAFTIWKAASTANRDPIWEELPGSIKRDVRQSLLKEQGYICCYCETRASEKTSHIEHLRPQSIYPEDVFNYVNLLASCQQVLGPKEPRHCGSLKGNWYDPDLMVSPLSPDCADRFRYTADGGIYPKQDGDTAAMVSISRLGLNISKLQGLRSKAIEAIIGIIGTLTKAQTILLADVLLKRNKDDEFPEFCTAIVYILRNYA